MELELQKQKRLSRDLGVRQKRREMTLTGKARERNAPVGDT